MNEKLLRLAVLIFTALLHITILLFFFVRVENFFEKESQTVRVMKLTDFNEISPPVVEDELPPVIEELTEIYIETDIQTETNVATVIDIPQTTHIVSTIITSDYFFPMHQLSNPPQFDEKAIAASLVYPQMALRSGIEGKVFIELFVEQTGIVQKTVILREDPEGWGFGEAAVKVFTGRKGTPALLNGEPVSARFRYPVTFKSK
jgi:protein TonB